jgi:hypothetical protein
MPARLVTYHVKIRAALAPTILEMFQNAHGSLNKLTPEAFLAEIIEAQIAQFRLLAIDAGVPSDRRGPKGLPSGPPLVALVATQKPRGRKAKLSDEDREAIRVLLNEGMKPAEVAGRFGKGGRRGTGGLSTQTVRRIKWLMDEGE